MKQFIATLSAIVLVVVMTTACKSTQSATTANNYPDWLESKLEVLNERYSEIRLFEVEGQPYYAIFVKGPERSYDMNRTTIYDATGEVYLSLGGPRRPSEKENQFFEKAINKGVIWQSDIAKKQNVELTPVAE